MVMVMVMIMVVHVVAVKEVVLLVAITGRSGNEGGGRMTHLCCEPCQLRLMVVRCEQALAAATMAISAVTPTCDSSGGPGGW